MTASARDVRQRIATFVPYPQVLVLRFVTAGTVEERVMGVSADKAALADRSITGGGCEPWCACECSVSRMCRLLGRTKDKWQEEARPAGCSPLIVLALPALSRLLPSQPSCQASSMARQAQTSGSATCWRQSEPPPRHGFAALGDIWLRQHPCHLAALPTNRPCSLPSNRSAAPTPPPPAAAMAS